MTPEEINLQLGKYKRLGTFFHPLVGLSRLEKKDYIAQMRRLRGEHYGLYFREQNRLQTLRSLKPGDTRELTDQEQLEIQKSVEAMRRLLVAAIHRVYEIGDDILIYHPTDKAPGDHALDQISIDLLEPDYIDLVHKLLVSSGLLVETTGADAPFQGNGRDDAGAAGLSGEAVQPTPEPAGEGITTGSSV